MDTSVSEKFILILIEKLFLRDVRTVDSDLIGDHPFLGLALSVPDASLVLNLYVLTQRAPSL